MRKLTIVLGSLAAWSLASVHSPPSSVDADSACVPLVNSWGVVTGFDCNGVWRAAPSPPPPTYSPPPTDVADDTSGDEPDYDTSGDGADTDTDSGGTGGVAESSPARPMVDPGRLGSDSSVDAGGGGNGSAAPACVERALTRGGGFVNAVDDTGRSGIVYERRCADGSRQQVVRPGAPPAPSATGMPIVPSPPDPRALAQELYDEMIVRLPSPTVHVAPAEFLDEGWAYVQVPAFFWIEEWTDLTSSLTVGPVSVTLTVLPERIDVDLGNGDVISCVDPPAFPQGTDPSAFDGCEYIYRHSSAMAPNGLSWPVEVSMVWSASWSSNVGVGGNFGEVFTTTQRELQVAEIQAIITER